MKRNLRKKPKRKPRERSHRQQKQQTEVQISQKQRKELGTKMKQLPILGRTNGLRTTRLQPGKKSSGQSHRKHADKYNPEVSEEGEQKTTNYMRPSPTYLNSPRNVPGNATVKDTLSSGILLS